MSLLDDLLTSAIKSSYEKNKRKESVPSILGALKDPQFLQDMKRGVLDSVNRGAVASTIGGPVDLATMLMRPLGYNVEKPVGGSEWVGDKMQQLGLLGDTRNPIAEALASVAVPGAMAKVAPKVFQAEQAAIQNAKIAGPLSDGKFATQRGVFGGLNAKTADKAKLSQAEQMLNKGVDPAQVWKETGWGRGPDGKWRFEIPDNKAGVQPNGVLERALDKEAIAQGTPTSMPQWVYMNHDELYRGYPEVKGIAIKPTADVSGGAFYDAPSNTIGISAFGKDAKSSNLHELQHAIQQREGFARGGSPDSFTDYRGALERAKANGGFDPVTGDADFVIEQMVKENGADPMQAYQRLGGEAEARLVQSRMNLTPEERAAQYPWSADYFKQQTGVGLDDLIHRFRN